MNLYLGIDGGGTKTAAAILDDAGVELGRGQGGPGNIAVHSDADLLHSLRTAVTTACTEARIASSEIRFHGVCAAMAGVSIPERRRQFERLLSTEIVADRHRVEPDFVAAYWGAGLGEPGIVVIAGTGAVVYGRNGKGESCRADGLGYLLGDRGSGFDLGLRALRDALDRLIAGRPDALTQAILTHIGARSRDEILQWLYTDFRPARVAALAPVVGALAEAGDTGARHHIGEAARQLRQSALRVRARLHLDPGAPVYPIGGLWSLGAFFRSEFSAPITPHDAGLNLAPPHSDAAYGAALLAGREHVEETFLTV
jgi:N-acetylglucosamine kinase-like BadF-type ATPase